MDLADRHGAFVMVDDAHASGVMGKNGRGTPSHFGLSDRVQIQIGTLSKAVGAIGGYVAGERRLIDYLTSVARPFTFSSSHPPSVVATCSAAVDVMLEEPERIEKLWANARHFKEGLKKLGFDTGASETPITPVIVGDTKKAQAFSARLFEEGVFALAISFPIVARGRTACAPSSPPATRPRTSTSRSRSSARSGASWGSSVQRPRSAGSLGLNGRGSFGPRHRGPGGLSYQ